MLVWGGINISKPALLYSRGSSILGALAEYPICHNVTQTAADHHRLPPANAGEIHVTSVLELVQIGST